MPRATYNTKQKQFIYEFLLENKDKHLTCEEIGDALKNTGTPVGKATLYRFLEKLTQEGKVRKITDPESKSASFQLVDSEMKCESHMHLKCTGCGEFTHLGCEFMDSVGEHILKHHRFRIDNSKTMIYGLCENCAGKAQVE